MCQITRSHYQNAVTATRMDSSPQTPDADARLTEGNTPSPEPPATEHTAPQMPPQHTTTTLMPPPRQPSRPGSARTRGQQSSVPHSTSLLNEKNRIVREYPVSAAGLQLRCRSGGRVRTFDIRLSAGIMSSLRVPACKSYKPICYCYRQQLTLALDLSRC